MIGVVFFLMSEANFAAYLNFQSTTNHVSKAIEKLQPPRVRTTGSKNVIQAANILYRKQVNWRNKLTYKTSVLIRTRAPRHHFRHALATSSPYYCFKICLAQVDRCRHHFFF